jgi:hypothetical protein
MNLVRRIFIAAAIFILSPCLFAGSQDNAQAYALGVKMCEASAKLISGYAKWLSEARAWMDEQRAASPEKSQEIMQQFKVANEKSKDSLYEKTRIVFSNLRSNGDTIGLAKDINDLVMARAEVIGFSEPNMSRTYFQRNLESYCSEQIINLKLN